jgi:hypothetical protein
MPVVGADHHASRREDRHEECETPDIGTSHPARARGTVVGPHQPEIEYNRQSWKRKTSPSEPPFVSLMP